MVREGNEAVMQGATAARLRKGALLSLLEASLLLCVRAHTLGR